MKSFKLIGIDRFELFDVPMPVLKSNTDVLVKVGRVGVCGSDIHYYAEGGIGSQRVDYPWTVGHEGAGSVVAIGPEVNLVRVGDRIAFDPAMPCWRCEQCLLGRQHTCTNLKFLGCPQQVEGCLSEFIVLPERSCLPIPNSMSLDDAAMVEPVSIAVYAASLYKNLSGANVAVLGCGPIGLSLVQVLRAQGCASILVTDHIDDRLRAACAAQATWTGNPLKADIVKDIKQDLPAGLDVVFECCGQQDALDQAVQVLKPAGTLMVVGIPGTNRINFDINLLRRKEITIQNVRRQNDCMIKSLEMIGSGAVNARKMITHRFGFAQTAEAFDLVKNYRDGVIKAAIAFDEDN